jgi:hypothetical protein
VANSLSLATLAFVATSWPLEAERMTMQVLAFERNGKSLRGHFWTHDGMVTAKLSSRQKTTHIGGSPPRALAQTRRRLSETSFAPLGEAMPRRILNSWSGTLPLKTISRGKDVQAGRSM